MDIKYKIGIEFRRLRIEKTGLSQDDFARSLGYDKSYISRIESGKQNLTIDTIQMLCKALNITIQDLFQQIEVDEKYNEKNYQSY